MAVQIIDSRPYRFDAAIAKSRAISEGVRDTAFLIAHQIDQYNQQLEKDKHTKLATIGMLAGKYGFSKLGPDVTQEFERLSGVKFARDDKGQPVIPQTDEEHMMAMANEELNKLPPERKQEIMLGMADMTSKPKSQSEIDLANRKMELQTDYNNRRIGLDALRTQATIDRAAKGGAAGSRAFAKLSTPSGFMYDPKDKKSIIPWDGQGEQLNQQEFENYGKKRNIDKIDDEISRKHFMDQLREDKTELDKMKNAASIIANKNIPADNPAKLAAQAWMDTTARVKFGVEPPKKQTWGDWAKEIIGLKPIPEGVTQQKATNRAPAKITHTQEEWDATVKEHLAAGIKPEDILDQSKGDPMALQALINNGVGAQ